MDRKVLETAILTLGRDSALLTRFKAAPADVGRELGLDAEWAAVINRGDRDRLRSAGVNDGITILPELAAMDLTKKQLQLVRHFKRPAPMREVSLVVHRDFVKQRLVQALKEEIVKAIPEKVRQNKNQHVVPI